MVNASNVFDADQYVLGNSSRNGTFGSVLLPVSDSQVSGRKSLMSFDTYSGSHETVSDDCSLETPITSRNKNGESPLKVSFAPNCLREFVWLYNQPDSWLSAVVG